MFYQKFCLKTLVGSFFLGLSVSGETVSEESQMAAEKTCLQSGAKSWANERPDWLFNGERLVFGSKRDGNWELYSMNPDGSGQTRLTNTSESEIFPSVSRDGKRIAFVGTTKGNYDIFIMNIDGSGLTRLTEDGFDDKWATRSPDASKIALSSNRNGTWDIYVMDDDGKTLNA